MMFFNNSSVGETKAIKKLRTQVLLDEHEKLIHTLNC